LLFPNKQYSASIYSVKENDSDMIDGSDFVGEVDTEMVSDNKHVAVKINREFQVSIL